MSRFTVEQKLEIIRKVTQEGRPVYSVCREHKVSKVTFYKWLSRFKRARKNQKAALASRILRDGSHPRGLTFAQRRSILRLVKAHPEFSCRRIAQSLGLGHHGVQNSLYREGLNRFEARLEFANKPLWKRESAERREAMMKLFEEGWRVKDICAHFKISKVTFWKWKKRYLEAYANPQSLKDSFVAGQNHYKYMGQEKEQKVLDLVAQNPVLSVHRLRARLAGEIGHHGIQNVLVRAGLNTLESRRRFASEAQETKVKVAPLYSPQIPVYKWRMLFAPFKTVPRLLVTNPFNGILATLATFLPLTLIYLWLRSIVDASQNTSVLGLVFASIALFFGAFFFIYSLKYYLTVLLVLKLASSDAKAMEDKQSGAGVGDKGDMGDGGNMGDGGILGKLGIRLPKRRGVNPLLVNLEKVELKGENQPFVSVHVALFNEKRVVERLIKACTSQEWHSADRSSLMVHREEHNPMNDKRSTINDAPANYEVVIVDDSTDETTEIAKQSLISADFKLISTDLAGSALISSGANSSPSSVSVDTPGVEGTHTPGVSLQGEPLAPKISGESAENEVELFTFRKEGLPTVKLIHRTSRSGFKGGALQEALVNTDPQAAYVLVFDADFVPYPDTITQFVKTFQVLGGDQGDRGDEGSNIAAVQGYQWHVLNKSQNWITRGVRTEYAGSYVIERSGEEIYGGLKQIAGSVYCIRADILRQFGWGTSITEDFQLTLRLYEAGYKVAFTPYIQAPAEAVSTIKRLVRQRMRWAEGASFNVKCMFSRMLFGRWVNDTGSSKPDPVSGEQRQWVPSRLTLAEKLEFAYLAPYYLQAVFFVIGTFSWFLSEAVFHARLPFWTAALGWSLVFTNMLALPLMNIVGMFLEESDERDYMGIISFLALSYIIVPFQAYAALKGFLEKEEGPWFRTPKTGMITDVLSRSTFSKLFGSLLGGRSATDAAAVGSSLNARQSIAVVDGLQTTNYQLQTNLAFASAYNNFNFGPRITSQQPKLRFVGRIVLAILLILSLSVNYFVVTVPQTLATNPSSTNWYFRERVIGSTDSGEKQVYCVTSTDCKIVYHDDTADDLYFIDCDDATCSISTTTLLDGATGCVLTNCDSIATGHHASIYCLSSTDCKIAYRDNGNLDLRFADCEDSACSTGVTLLLDGRAGCLLTTGCAAGDVGKFTSIYCPAANDCKIAYYDEGGDDLEFADCDDDGVTTDGECESGTTTTVDSSATAVGTFTSTYCVTATDCKISYIDTTNTAIKFADCDTATCSTVTLSVLDGNTACSLTSCSTTRNNGQGTSIQCPATDDCKISYQDDGNDDLYMGDCAAADCSSGTTTLLEGAAGCVLTNCASSSVETVSTSIYCVATDDCKISYRRDGDLYMADCDDVDCDSAGNTDTTTLLDGAASCALTNCETTSKSHARDNSIYCSSTSDCKIFDYEETDRNIKFADCDNATCGSGTTITLDGNKKINGTAGAVTTTKTINTSGQIYTLVTNVEYPTGDVDGSLGTGDHTLHVDFTNLNAAGENITFHFHVGYCTIASDCQTKTSHVESSATTWDDTTTSPQNITVTSGSATSIPIAKETKWLYTEIHVTAVTGASPGFTMSMNNAAAGTADSNISIPALTVPEYLGLLIPVAPFLPKIVRKIKQKLKDRRKGKKLWRPR